MILCRLLMTLTHLRRALNGLAVFSLLAGASGTVLLIGCSAPETDIQQNPPPHTFPDLPPDTSPTRAEILASQALRRSHL
jgi:uncharacterized lipoprotein YajG